MNKWNKRLINEIKLNEDRYLKDYEIVNEAVSNSGAVYKGSPVPFHYMPRIYTEKDILKFEEAVKKIFNIVNKTIDLFLKYEEVRNIYEFDPRLVELIMLDHGYDTKVPMGRFDIFYYDDGSYMFCELNTDGSSAMNEEAELSAIIKKSAIARHIAETNRLDSFELFDSWIDEINLIYKEFRHVAEKKEKPKVAIIDFVDKGTSLEFEVYKEHFIENGFDCSIVDPRNVVCENGWMTVDGEIIDIVYRRLVTKDLMDRYEEIPEFIKGVKGKKTCIVGSLKSQIVHTKMFFAVLHNPDVRKYFDAEELEFIDASIPETIKIDENMEMDKFIKNKENYILKPIDYYASKGVIAGEGTEDKEWQRVLKEKSTEGYLIQKYCPVSYWEGVLPGVSGFDIEKFRTITGLYVYNEKFKGIYTRAGLNSIISGIHDGYTLSSLVVS